MSLEVLIVLIALTAAGYWFFVRPRGAAKRNQPRSSPPASLAPEVTPTPRTEEDTFLTEITRAKAAVESAASSAGAEQARELDAKFGADIALKEQLSKFALESGLDDALIALWDEVKYYPSWSQREDFTKWNKLALSGIAGSKENDTESVAFAGPSSHYRIAKRGWIGMEGNPYADFAFFEDDEEVFAIRCSVDYGDYGTTFRCHDINALRKRGNWAKDLLAFYKAIRIEAERSRAGFRYHGAENIRKRFEE